LTYLERQKSYGSDKLRWEEAEEEAEAKEEEKNQTKLICLPSFKRRHNYHTITVMMASSINLQIISIRQFL
jgi:hypothetical protein